MISSEVYKKEHVYVGIGDYEVSFAYDISANIIVEWVSPLGVLSGAKTEGVDYDVVTVSSVAYVRVLIDFGANGVLTIRRDLPLTQTFNFVDGVDPPPSSIMRAIDRVVWMCQQIFDAVSGSLRTPAHESLDMTIPTIIERAMGFQGYDAAGLPVIYAGIPSVPVSSYVAPGLALTDQQSFLNYYGMGNFQKSDFTSTVAGWVTLLRTQKNFAGIVKISAYADNLKDFITFSVYGHEDTGDHDITVLEQSRKGSIEGITKVRWGDAGAGNGLCLQLYVDPDTDPSIVVRATTFAAGPIDSSTGVGFQLGPHINTTTDYDDNMVTTFRTVTRAVLGEYIKSNPFRGTGAKDLVVDGVTITHVYPGVYNSIQFTGNGTMDPGHYVVINDFIVDSGKVVTCLYRKQNNYDGYNENGSLNIGKPIWMAGDIIGQAQVNGSIAGGGKGAVVTQIAGGSGPCGNSGSQGTGPIWSKSGGGYLFLNILGKFTNNGTMHIDGEDGETEAAGERGSAGAGGGLFNLRTLSEGITIGIISCDGGDGGNDTHDGGGGGGGQLEIYAIENIATGGTLTVAVGARGTGGTVGSIFRIDLTAQEDKIAFGGSDIVTNDEYLNAGFALQFEGWWL